MKKTLLTSLITLLISTSVVAEEGLTADIKTLTTPTALRIAQASLAECEKMGIPIGVTVLDRWGRALAVLRDTKAPDLTLDISQRKAYTAVSFNVATSQLKSQSTSPLAYTPSLAIFPGGVTVKAAGVLIGSVGVSGAPSGLDDEKCAAAGVKAVQEDLDFL
jgi:uncharacterized protein GlcG (DUF336 family)